MANGFLFGTQKERIARDDGLMPTMAAINLIDS